MSRNLRKRVNRSALHIIAALIVVLSLLGCARLPNLRKAVQEFSAPPPSIVDVSGPLTLQESHSVISLLRQEAGRTDILGRHIAVEEALSGKPLTRGNKVELLCDGPETLESMGEAIRNAADHINLETFIIRDDEVGRPLADSLIRRRGDGVRVNFLYDSFGAIRTPQSFFDRMSTHGVDVLEFNPIGSAFLNGEWGINNRDHRKILVVDGKIAFTGGINFYRVYSRSPSDPPRREEEGQAERYWRDTHIRIEGPAVAEFQELFMEMWRLQKGRDPAGSGYFPSLEQAGDSLVRVIAGSPYQPVPKIYAAYISAITHAERSIHLSQAYLVLDKDMLEALSDSAQEGVEVKIIVPSFSDLWLPFHAARHNYSTLLKAGVRIYEKQGALLHSKTAVIDGVWSTVGSSNLGFRSFLHDAEVNAVILGRDFGGQMEEAFARDIAASAEVTLEEWERRPFGDRVKERIARLFKYWL